MVGDEGEKTVNGIDGRVLWLWWWWWQWGKKIDVI